MGRFLVVLCIVVGFVVCEGVASGGSTPNAGQALTVAVDPRVELMSLIFRLAGNPEYNKCRIPSYDGDVESHFAPFKEHRVVKLAARLREERGISYDAPMTLAVHLVGAESLRPRVPLDPRPAGLDQRWRTEDVKEFLAEARGFADATQFAQFFEAHKPLYTETTRRLRESIQRSAHLEWFDDFYGRSAQPSFHVIAGMLNGPGSYGPHFGEGKAEEIYCIRGVWAADRNSTPFFSDEGVIIHEFSHSYVNPVVFRHLPELEDSGKRIFASEQEQMRRMAYGHWETVMYESLVRACEIRYARKHKGRIAALRRKAEESARGFRWVGPLSDLLGEYEASRREFPDLDSFMPHVVTFFDHYAESLQGSRRWDRMSAMLSLGLALVLQPVIATALAFSCLAFAAIMIRRRRRRAARPMKHVPKP